MAQSKARTRHSSSSPLVEYLGPGKEFLPPELPTLRAALQLGIHLQDDRSSEEGIFKNKYTKKEMLRDISLEVLAQWKKANHLFQSPVLITQGSLEIKMEKEWDRTVAKLQGL